VPVEGRRNFQRFLDEGFRQFRAEPEDWALHAGSVFPEVRLRRGYVEIRAMDSVSPALALAAAAFWRGLLEDGEASKEAFRLTATPSMRERMELHHAASRNGLRARWQGRSLREWMLALLKLARRGLARFEREKEFLAPLERLVEGGDCPAETALARWRPEWKSGPEDFVEAFRLRAGNFKD
jgi:glutamate--cysteine ligase